MYTCVLYHTWDGIHTLCLVPLIDLPDICLHKHYTGDIPRNTFRVEIGYSCTSLKNKHWALSNSKMVYWLHYGVNFIPRIYPVKIHFSLQVSGFGCNCFGIMMTCFYNNSHNIIVWLFSCPFRLISCWDSSKVHQRGVRPLTSTAVILCTLLDRYLPQLKGTFTSFITSSFQRKGGGRESAFLHSITMEALPWGRSVIGSFYPDEH